MKTFKKTFKIYAEASDVYSALTNPFTIELWSGYPAEMSEEPGSEFSLWEGDISGKNLIHKGQEADPEWYFGDQEEKSIVTIDIKPDGENSVVTVEHSNIPDEEFDQIAEGWREYYIGAIAALFSPISESGPEARPGLYVILRRPFDRDKCFYFVKSAIT